MYVKTLIKQDYFGSNLILLVELDKRTILLTDGI
jgi:hypothetical protein